MSQALLAHVSNSSVKKDVPVLKPGYVVRVHQRIKEGEKERVQIFEGLVIKLSSGARATDKTFTVRKVVEGVGVEKVFPLHSPLLEKIEVMKSGKVRRSKLYYMRTLEGKSTRLRDKKGGVIEMLLATRAEEQSASEPALEDVEAVEEVKEEAVPEETPEIPPEEVVDETPETPVETPAEEKQEKQE
ncbi:50S ribosomal protein L19 [Candidatus Peregrinibacteria bacterium]|nr:MAG: 50S ribosomal protein L19 [Candidatus Peregrinibacteria bacterium]